MHHFCGKKHISRVNTFQKPKKPPLEEFLSFFLILRTFQIIVALSVSYPEDSLTLCKTSEKTLKAVFDNKNS